MNVILYIDNLATYITEEELKTLFVQVGETIAGGINNDRINGAPKDEDHRFSTAEALDQIDRAVAKFSAYSTNGSTLRVRLAIPEEQRSSLSQIFEP
jgi:RNA recognition motif-containing protein